MAVTITVKGVPYTAGTAAKAQALAAKDTAPVSSSKTTPPPTTNSSLGGGGVSYDQALANLKTGGLTGSALAAATSSLNNAYGVGTPAGANFGASVPGTPAPVAPVVPPPVAPVIPPATPATTVPTPTKTTPPTSTTPDTTSSSSSGGSSQQPSNPTGTAAGVAPTVNLTPGQSGTDVAALQNYLVANGYMTQDQMNTGPGTYGPHTKAAVEALQTALGVNAGPDAGYYGPQTQAAIAKGSGGGTDGSAATPDSTGASSYDNTKATPTTPQKSAVQQVIDDYTTAYKSLGLGDVKSEYEDFVKQKTDLQNATNAKISDVNNNPWLSQGVRDRMITRINDDAKGSLDTLTNQISLLDAMYKQGQAEVDSIVTKAESITADQVKAAAAIADQKQKAADALTLDKQKADEAAKLANTKASVATKTVAGGSTLVDSEGHPIYTAPKIANPKTGGTGSKKGGSTPSAAQLAAGEAKLKASKGPDGYVDPAVYQQAYNDWPGTSATFLSKYPPKLYVNPANTTLPSYLRPAASKSSTTVTNPFAK